MVNSTCNNQVRPHRSHLFRIFSHINQLTIKLKFCLGPNLPNISRISSTMHLQMREILRKSQLSCRKKSNTLNQYAHLFINLKTQLAHINEALVMQEKRIFQLSLNQTLGQCKVEEESTTEEAKNRNLKSIKELKQKKKTSEEPYNRETLVPMVFHHPFETQS